MSLLKTLQFSENITATLHLADHDRLVIGFASGLIKIIDNISNSPIERDFDELHYDSIRVLIRVEDTIISAAKDNFILKLSLDLDVIEEYEVPHSATISTLAYDKNHDYFISGDDEGTIEIYKLGATLTKLQTYTDAADYISKIVVQHNYFIASSGDGTVYKYMYNEETKLFTIKPRFSPTRDEDYVDFIFDKRGSKIIVAAGESLVFFKDELDHFDLFPVDFVIEKIALLDSNLLIVACGDGIVRLIQVFPRKIFGVIAVHSVNETSVAFMEVSEKLLITAGFDGLVKIWDISNIRESLSNEKPEKKVETNEKTVSQPKKVIEKVKIDEDDEDSDDLGIDLDFDEENASGLSRRAEKKMKKLKGKNRKLAESGVLATHKVDKKKAARADFFNDL